MLFQFCNNNEILLRCIQIINMSISTIIRELNPTYVVVNLCSKKKKVDPNICFCNACIVYALLCIFSKFPGLKDIGVFHFKFVAFFEKTSIMTKMQGNLLVMYTKVNSNTFNVEISDSPISQDSHGSSNLLNVIQKTNLEWKDVWFDLYDWVHFDRKLRRVFC